MRRWSLIRDNNRWVIKQGNKRLPVSQYRALRQDEDRLREYVKRLNAPLELKKKVEYRHAFINDALLSEYQDWLSVQVPSEKNTTREVGYLHKHFLSFFIITLDMPNPLSWHEVHDTKWARALLEKKLAPDTLKGVVQAANRFMKWLHKRRPGEVPPLDFRPISKAKLKELKARREMDGEKERKAISGEDIKAIRQNCGEALRGFIELAYYYGLRRSECLGIRPDDIRHGYLSVERQLDRTGDNRTYRPLKGRQARRVPHWYCSPDEAHKWAEQIQAHIIYPDTLSRKWAELMKTLKLTYDFHDLRHTFVTRALGDGHSARDVQLAAGHKNIETTMRYAHDHRSLDDKPYKPAA